jgi:hypothetical protein
MSFWSESKYKEDAADEPGKNLHIQECKLHDDDMKFIYCNYLYVVLKVIKKMCNNKSIP